jgi:hypothetical protein
MARRYTRDNRGRFASVGATARGGRLATAAGNKRATVKASPGIATRMSSAPKGTVGKTRSARFSQHVDRPLADRPAYKQRFNDQKAAIQQRKAPREMNLEQFARQTGGKTRLDGMSNAIEVSRQPHGRTKAGDRRNGARTAALNKEIADTKAAYGAAIKSGKIKAPVDSLARKAQGHPDNPAVQAAQRILAKNAARKAAAASRADTASVNIPMRGARGRALDRDISRAVKEVKAAEIARLMKPKAQVRAERAARAEANRQAAAAKPKRVRSADSLRVSRAKRILKEREIKTSGTLRQWEQSKRTQERALAFYKARKRK